MCLRPPTPRSLTEPVSFGFIDPSRRVSRAELDRMDKLWRQKQQRNGTYIHATNNGTTIAPAVEGPPRSSFESDMTRVEGRVYPQQPLRQVVTQSSTAENQKVSTRWPFSRKSQQSQAVW